MSEHAAEAAEQQADNIDEASRPQQSSEGDEDSAEPQGSLIGVGSNINGNGKEEANQLESDHEEVADDEE